MATELNPLSSAPKSQDDSKPLLTDPPASTESLDELSLKYAPFVRRDVYGVMGRGELPLVEKILLLVAMLTVLPIRLILGILVLVCYYLVCRVCTLFCVVEREDGVEDYSHVVGWRRDVIFGAGRFCSRVMLFIFGFYWIQETHLGAIDQEGKEQTDQTERPGVTVSNHVSYIDILYHMSTSFPSFVAKRSVAKLPLVGLISKCLGCVYVQRESKSADFKGVSGLLTERIQDAHQNESSPAMLIFPEGTTTNGDFLLPFKTGAFLAKAPVVPVILRYPYSRFSPAWDSIAGARHVLLLLCQFVNYIEVIRLPIYKPSKQEKEDPTLFASNVRKLMATEGNLTLSEIGLAEKRVYHAALNGLLSQR